MRHAESENVVGGVAGAVPAAPLTARGHAQATAAAASLADEPIAGIYTSTALRARQTAMPLGEPVALPELGEVSLGAQEGSRDPAVAVETARVLHGWVVDDDLALRVGDGESGAQVVARVTAALRRIVAAHGEETVVVVGHVSSLTVTLARLCGLGARVWGTPLPHAEPFLVEWDGERWQCPAWPGVGAPPAPDFQPSGGD
jgi:alpha-ribazole phosphatase/probable phosphoglycerate mutase